MERSARVVAMDYLARREHTRVELVRKLESKGFDLVEINETLDRLQSQQLLNDARFAEGFAEGRVKRGAGPLKIRVELAQHGVDETLINDVINALDVDWGEQAQQVWQKKFSQKPTNMQERAKQQRFLQQRGFSHEHFNFLSF